MFSAAWFAAGIVTTESATDFARFAATNPGRSARDWRWAAFRDFMEEHTPLTADECRLAYRLGESEPDVNLGTAIQCSVLYQPACSPEVVDAARGSERIAVRRAAERRVA
jgi:hypothetical protein